MLLECPEFTKLREEILSQGRKTDLFRLLGITVFVTKVSRFLIATDKLYQYRYLTEVKTNNQVSCGEAKMEDSW